MKERFNWLLTVIVISVGYLGLSAFTTPHANAQLGRNEASTSQVSISSADAFLKAQAAIQNREHDQALKLLKPFTTRPDLYPTHVSDYISALYWSGRTEEAVHFFSNLPATFPFRDYLLLNMAKAYFDLNEFEASTGLYNRILQRNPDNLEAISGLVKNLLAEQKGQDASELLLKYKNKWDQKHGLQILYAQSLLIEKNYIEYLKEYDRLFAQYPENIVNYTVTRDSHLKELSPEEKKDAIDSLKKQFDRDTSFYGEYLVLLTCLFEGSKSALAMTQEYRLDPAKFAPTLASPLAWEYFSQGDGAQALFIYRALLAHDPELFEARLGEIYSLTRTEIPQYQQATKLLNKLELKYPNNLKVLYAKAFLFEQQGLFYDAIQTYDSMLNIAPENLVVKRLQIRAYSDLGATLHALHLADESFPHDKLLYHSIIGDYAVNTVEWEEPEQAIAIYNAIFSDENLDNRFLFDDIIASGKANQHDRAIGRFEKLSEKKDIVFPYWVEESVAGSYLYAQKAEEAKKHYESAYKKNNKSRIAIEGLIDTTIELREWKSSEKLIDELDENTPDYLLAGTVKYYNDDQLALDIKRGWHLMYQNRLRDADEYLESLYKKIPGNIDVRSARAHLHGWRGWPRMAEQEFNIINSMDPGYLPAKTGHITVLNDLARKEEARNKANSLYQMRPWDKNVQQLVRDLSIEDKHENRFEASYVSEDDGGRDWVVQDELSTPLSLYTRLYAYYFLRKTWNDDPDSGTIARGDNKAVYFKRAGLGLTQIFNENWFLRQQFSADYEDWDEFGSLTEMRWNPDDYWQLTGSFDTFSVDIAQQARITDVTAKKASLGVRFRESEWREYNMGFSRQFFSDDNDRDELSLGYEQNLFIKNDWRMRTFFNAFSMWNSRWDDPNIWYYNPENVWGLSATLMTEQTLWDVYEEYFAHRLYLTLGNSKQQGYADGVIGSIKYEQDFTFSHAHTLVWSVWYGENLYDGDRVGSLGINAIWSIRF